MRKRKHDSQLEREAGRGTPRMCDVPGCFRSTREAKPYCPDHVDHHPYVQKILEDLSAQEEEEELVRQKGGRAKVDMNGPNIRNILLMLLMHGPRTEERLARETLLDAKVLDGYLKILARKGYISFGRTNRGSTVIKLKKLPPEAAEVGIPDTETKESA